MLLFCWIMCSVVRVFLFVGLLACMFDYVFVDLPGGVSDYSFA